MIKETPDGEIIIKHNGQRGTRSIKECRNCGQLFSELNIRIRNGEGVFCCNECYKEYRLKNKRDEKTANKLYQKKHKYGLTSNEYYNLFESQGNRCAICNEEFSDKLKGVVDHNHKTEIVRGILCQRCNTLLGMARDDERILEKAIEYLRKYKSKAEQGI